VLKNLFINSFETPSVVSFVTDPELTSIGSLTLLLVDRGVLN
jgi:hypothetical protein